MTQNAPACLACRVDRRGEITGHYERVTTQHDQGQWGLSLEDSRVQHHLTPQTDSYDNIPLDALAEYGKPSGDLLELSGQRKQKETYVSYAKTVYSSPVESDSCFQDPLVAEVRAYRVFTADSATVGGQDRHGRETLAQHEAGLLRDTVEMPIDVDPQEQLKHSNPKGYRILLADERALYTSTDLSEPLPVGVLDKFSIAYQKYQLVFTSRLLQRVLAGARPAVDRRALTAERDITGLGSDAGHRPMPQAGGWQQ
jgi:hypothetical protein